jgi:hypothetical protein
MNKEISCAVVRSGFTMLLTFWLGLNMVALCQAQVGNQYFRFLGDQPIASDFRTFFSDGCQGVAADDSNWFFSEARNDSVWHPDHPATVWKVPFKQQLNLLKKPASCLTYEFTAKSSFKLDIPELSDLDQFNGYVFVGGGFPQGKRFTAVLKSSDMSLVATSWSLEANGCFPVVYPDGSAYLYQYFDVPNAKNIKEGHIRWWKFDWNKMTTGNLALSQIADWVLLDRDNPSPWQSPMHGGHMQSAKFSPDGRMLYVLWSANNDNCHNPDVCRHGIHAFMVNAAGAGPIPAITSTAHLIQSSTQNPKGPLFCEFHEADSQGQEPEGLVVHDVSDGRAPGVGGQLHVLIVLNSGHTDFPVIHGIMDTIIFKHYSR